MNAAWFLRHSRVVTVLSVVLYLTAEPGRTANGSRRIQPYPENPRYWQYQGRPVVLLGASDDDNLFQWHQDRLEKHLDLLASVGGNYVRNTMSSRDEGNLWPFQRRPDGKYDLDRFNEDYWQRFERFLRLARERDIIVQIELWDQFDYKAAPVGEQNLWGDLNPYNPKNNVNYTADETGLNGPLGNLHGPENGFFRSVPELEDNRVLLRYQRRQVDRVLDISLAYPNVLYCIDNETHGPPEWGQYWARHIRARAQALGVGACVTEMWNQNDLRGPQHRATFDHPQIYPFVDISQNSRNMGQVHWDNIMWVADYLASHPRPLNNVKIYGGQEAWWGSGSARDGVERFWRNVIGGCASARMHRPDYGLGLSPVSQAAIKSARMLLQELDIFQCRPDATASLLDDRQANEAYLTCIAGRQYAVYFPQGGEVTLDVSACQGSLNVRWLHIAGSRWQPGQTSCGAGGLRLKAPSADHWVALVKMDGKPVAD